MSSFFLIPTSLKGRFSTIFVPAFGRSFLNAWGIAAVFRRTPIVSGEGPIRSGIAHPAFSDVGTPKRTIFITYLPYRKGHCEGHYKEYKQSIIPQIGESVLAYWKKIRFSKKSRSNRDGAGLVRFLSRLGKMEPPGIHHEWRTPRYFLPIQDPARLSSEAKRWLGITQWLPWKLQVEKELWHHERGYME